jgi:hypothetical protein
MTETTQSGDSTVVERRDVMRAVGATLVAGFGAAALTASSAASAQQQSAGAPRGRDDAPLGRRLQGVQHFGVTVQNMDRAFEFYTDVLGGNEVMRDGDFHGDPIHNTILTHEEIIAHERKVDPRTVGVPDLRGGSQRLDVRFVQFDNVVIELLQYRDAAQPMGSGDSWAEPRDHMSPPIPARCISVSTSATTSISTSLSVIWKPRQRGAA